MIKDFLNQMLTNEIIFVLEGII
jgi:hypothetical protein